MHKFEASFNCLHIFNSLSVILCIKDKCRNCIVMHVIIFTFLCREKITIHNCLIVGTVKSCIFIGHLILWVGQSMNLRSPWNSYSLNSTIAYILKSTNSSVYKHVQCRQTTKLHAHKITWFPNLFAECSW